MKRSAYILPFFFGAIGCTAGDVQDYELLVSNLNAGNVLRFDGHTGTRLPDAVSADNVPEHLRPRGFRPSSTVAMDDRLIVANFDDGQLLEFYEDGRFSRVFSRTADETVHLEEPCAITRGQDAFFVLHNDTSNVAQLHRDGSLLDTLGASSDMPPIRNAHGIAARDTHIYIATSPSRRDLGLIQVWDSEKRERVFDFAPYGEIEDGTGLTLTPNGTLLVADWFGSQVKEYDPVSGQLLGTVLDASDGLNQPMTMEFARDGRLYVLHAQGVLRVDVDGSVDPVWVSGEQNGFDWARGLSIAY